MIGAQEIEGFPDSWKILVGNGALSISTRRMDRRLLKSTTAANPQSSYDSSSISAIDKDI